MSLKLEKWLDEFKEGHLQDDPDLPYSRNPRVRFITYGPYVKFVLFPEVLFQLHLIVFSIVRLHWLYVISIFVILYIVGVRQGIFKI